MSVSWSLGMTLRWLLHCLIFYIYFYLGEIALQSCAGFCFYSAVFISAIQQRKSAMILRLSLPSWASPPHPRVASRPSQGPRLGPRVSDASRWPSVSHWQCAHVGATSLHALSPERMDLWTVTHSTSPFVVCVWRLVQAFREKTLSVWIGEKC